MVSDGDLVPLQKTITSILLNCEGKKVEFSVLVQPAKNCFEIENALAGEYVTINRRPDTGIYNGMNLLIDRGLADSLGGYWCFLNSGDELIALPNIRAFSKDAVIYSDVFLGFKKIVRSRILPYFLKMPHHQSMFIPESFFHRNNYRYPEHFPIAADLHLKIKLWSGGYKYVKNPAPVARAEEGGVSTKFSFDLVSVRSREMGDIAREFFRPTHAVCLHAFYFVWFAVRVFFQGKL